MSEKISLNKLSETFKVRFLGMGFLWAWIYCCWFSPALFPDRVGIGVNASSSWLISCIAVAVTLIVTPLLFRKRLLYSMRWMRIVQLVLQCAGTVLMADSSITGIESEALHLIGSVATGVGCGWLWIMWGELYSRLDTERVEAVTPASAIIIPLCLVLAGNLQGMVALITIALLPAISGILLMLAFEDESTQTELPEHEAAQGKSVFWIPFLRVGFGSIVIYLTFAVLWTMVTAEELNVIGQAFQAPFIVGALFAIALSVSSILFAKRLDLFTLYRWLLPVLVLALAFFTLEQSLAKAFSYTLNTVVQVGFDIMVWIYFSRLARNGTETPAICLGMSRGFVQVGVVLGNLFGIALVDAISNGAIELYQVCLIFICICTATVAYVLNFERPVTVSAEGAASAHPVSALASGPNQGQGAFEADTTAFLMAIGEEAGLSVREQEVFSLLARGRSLPYIRDELYISKNTVDTHVKSIYRKIDVHSKQELIDFVEARVG